MVIDRIYQLVQYICNKEQRGDLPPAKFNLLVWMAQLEFITKRVGNLNIINERGVPQIGYESTWRIHEDLRPMVYGPEIIPIAPSGNFYYPYGYIWPDAVHKTDFTPIKRITADQYPHIKRSRIIPPTESYPIAIFRHPYGFIDPYSIGSFAMSYLKTPPVPVWGYGMINNRPVFDANTSVDVQVPPTCIQELTMMILQHVGINLDAAAISQYALTKESTG